MRPPVASCILYQASGVSAQATLCFLSLACSRAISVSHSISISLSLADSLLLFLPLLLSDVMGLSA